MGSEMCIRDSHKITNANLVDDLEAMVRKRVESKEAADKDIIATD